MEIQALHTTIISRALGHYHVIKRTFSAYKLNGSWGQDHLSQTIRYLRIHMSQTIRYLRILSRAEEPVGGASACARLDVESDWAAAGSPDADAFPPA